LALCFVLAPPGLVAGTAVAEEVRGRADEMVALIGCK
jgi:hypothetical protein